MLLFVVLSLSLSACLLSVKGENKISSTSENLISDDLSDNVSIYKCLYNEEYNSAYVKFHSYLYGNDEAIILLDDNSIFYASVASTIKENDYDKIIEYGDYILMMYQIENNNNDWVEIKV